MLVRRQVEQDQISGIGSDAVAQHVDDAALGDFALQTVEELLALQVALEPRHNLSIASGWVSDRKRNKRTSAMARSRL